MGRRHLLPYIHRNRLSGHRSRFRQVYSFFYSCMIRKLAYLKENKPFFCRKSPPGASCFSARTGRTFCVLSAECSFEKAAFILCRLSGRPAHVLMPMRHKRMFDICPPAFTAGLFLLRHGTTSSCREERLKKNEFQNRVLFVFPPQEGTPRRHSAENAVCPSDVLHEEPPQTKGTRRRSPSAERSLPGTSATDHTWYGRFCSGRRKKSAFVNGWGAASGPIFLP